MCYNKNNLSFYVSALTNATIILSQGERGGRRECEKKDKINNNMFIVLNLITLTCTNIAEKIQHKNLI